MMVRGAATMFEGVPMTQGERLMDWGARAKGAR
jgi:hypothetical protein